MIFWCCFVGKLKKMNKTNKTVAQPRDEKNAIDSKLLIVLIVLVTIVVGAYFVFFSTNSTPSSNDVNKGSVKLKGLDAFASCLKKENLLMYGTFWCGACKSQKKLFKSSWQYAGYVECSNSDKSQTKACSSVGIDAYPTWVDKDGKKYVGVQSFETLSSISGCVFKNES